MQTLPRKYDAVVIVASHGGIPALITLLASLPADFPIPVFIVQHRTSDRPSRLAEILGRATKLDVKEAKTGDRPVGGGVYIAPTDLHLLITQSRRVALSDGRRVRHVLSAGDPLFRSAAKVYGSGVIAVVLTGMDSDGARGIIDVKAAGVTVLAQDKATSLAFAMPHAAIATGCVDEVLPIDEIGPQLVRLVDGESQVNASS